MQSDILCLQETYMMMSMENEQFKKFNCISKCIEHGVMILVKKYIPILEHMHFEEQNVEALITKAMAHGSQIAILNIYGTPHATLTSILNTIATTFHHLHLNEIIFILGHFHIDMLQSNEKTRKLEKHMCSYSLQFLLQKVNHVQKTLIDHVW
jgi:hypothetical protein